jgi:hypothetical protein
VYDTATATGVLYLNGAQAGQTAVPGGVSPSGPLVMGSAIWGTIRQDHLWGAIDDVRAWNRPLPATEIAALYTAGRT